MRASRPNRTPSRERVHSRLALGLQAILLVGIALSLWDRQWLTALVTAFEFGMDVAFGLTMQKGLVDTMGDLVVDVIGAAVIALLGYGYLRTKEVDSFLERWIERYLEGNQ